MQTKEEQTLNDTYRYVLKGTKENLARANFNNEEGKQRSQVHN
jgi:hypothetical protein